MKKQTTRSSTWEPEIDASYEAEITRLGAIEGSVTDYPLANVERPQPAPRNALVLPERQAQRLDLSISPQDSAFLAQGHQAVAQVINAPRPDRENTSHTRQVDDAMGVAQASAFYALLYILGFAAGLGALLAIVYHVKGGDKDLYFGAYVLLLSVSTYWALRDNRKQGLYHSSTGLGHHALENDRAEINSRERIALGIVDKHIGLLEKKMLVELEMRRLEDKRNG